MALELHIVQKPHEISFSGNPIQYFFSFTPYGLTEQRQDIRLQIRVEMEVSVGSDTYKEIKAQTLIPDKTGSMFADISSICHSYLEWYIPRPSLNKLLEIRNQSARFRLVIIAQQDGQLIAGPITTDPITVIKGGLAYENNQVKKFFTQYIEADKNPLHFFTDSEKVASGDKRYMSWIYPHEATTEVQTLKLKTYQEGGNVVTQTATFRINARKHALYICPIGLDDLKAMMPVDLYPDLTVKYEVSIVTDTNVVIVAPVTFYVDYRNFYDSRNLLFVNSPGGIDGLRILGEVEYAGEYSSNNAVSIPPPAGVKDAILQPQDFDVENTEIEKFTGSTEFIPLKKLSRLRDLLLSRSVYEYKSGVLIPVRILKKSLKFYNSKDDLYGMTFEWQHAFSNSYYTPQNIIQADDTCPAMNTFIVRQINKRKLQIVWSLPLPYDLIELTIDNGNPTELTTQQLRGNSGSEIVLFNNPAVYPATASITVKARIICDFDRYPESLGPYSTQVLSVYANTLPIANDDTFSLAMGYTTPQTLSGSVLDNDYDPDDDAINVIPATSQPTTSGGTYSIDSAGIIQYTPPNPLFNGVDSFTYTIQETANPAITATATVRINVGNVNLGNAVYVKLVETDRVENITPATTLINGNYYLRFYADPLGTIPRNVTGLGLTVNVRKKSYTYGPATNQNQAWTLVSTVDTANSVGGVQALTFSGELYFLTFRLEYTLGVPVPTYTGRKVEFSLLPGTGYVPIS